MKNGQAKALQITFQVYTVHSLKRLVGYRTEGYYALSGLESS